ncbi:hypothetical protein LSH36_84g01015 [Paralvinella palmiformis]|uniref:Ig-like domain-containing protein n=1 Tax=Paralvinella palmiformis TaxID=53620 RepID=A0AAD9K1G0_9ANNE|nr:hypothetical protein LSH36_84g01015 [Paralvinella palmiformis]
MTSFLPPITRFVGAMSTRLPVTCLVLGVLLALAPSSTLTCPTWCACFTGSDGNVASCRYQNLDRVPRDLPTDIVELDMGHCHLRKLDKGTFPDLPRLRRLTLDWCKVERIEERTFSKLKSVEYIKLSDNAISYVHPMAFRDLGGLRILHLDNNQIRILPYAVFSELRLDELLLNNNSIHTLDNRVFEGSSVVSLNLDENNISNISIELFTPLRKSLKNFNLSHNEQPLQLETDVFSGFNFSDLKISYDGLRDSSFLNYIKAYSLDISGHEFNKLNFTECVNFRSLEEIYLRSLNIEILNETILGNLASVTLLDLTDNLLFNIDGEVFSYTPRLRVLRLDRNRFVSLPENLGLRLGRLEVLKVPRNKLAMIRPDAFSGMANIRELDVRNNNIQVIQESMRQTFTNLETIRMAGNPLHCNCEMRWYRKWLDQSNKDTGAFQCYSPQAKSIYAMSPIDFVCRPPNVTYVTGSTNAVADSSVYLTCVARGDPAPEVEWSSPFGEVVSVTPPFNRTRYATYAIWHVSIIQQYQAGWYTCRAKNIEGTTEKSMYIHVYEPGGSTIDVRALTTPTTSTSTTRPTTSSTTTSTTSTTTTASTTTSTTTTTTTTTHTTTTPSSTPFTTSTTTPSQASPSTSPGTISSTPPTTMTSTTVTHVEHPDTTPPVKEPDKSRDGDKRTQLEPGIPTWVIVVIVVGIVGAILLVTIISIFTYRALDRKHKRKYDVNRDRRLHRSDNNNEIGVR